jgi:hypothetical protein
MRVQLELKARGFYAGSIDGRLTDQVRNSFRASDRSAAEGNQINITYGGRLGV